MSVDSGWTINEADDWDDDEPADYDGLPERERPLAGCACEGALIADTVCGGCIAYMQEQDAEIERERLERASTFTVEECVHWLAVCDAAFGGRYTVASTIRSAAARNLEALRVDEDNLRFDSRWCAKKLTEWRDAGPGPLLDDRLWRLRSRWTAWVLCTMAIRAVEREKEAMRRWG